MQSSRRIALLRDRFRSRREHVSATTDTPGNGHRPWLPRQKRRIKALRTLVPDGQDGAGLARYLSGRGKQLIAGRERHVTVFGTTYVLLRLPSPREQDHTLLRLSLWAWSIVPIHLTLVTRFQTPRPVLTVAFASVVLAAWACITYMLGEADLPKRPPGRITAAQIVAPSLALGACAPLVPLGVAGGLKAGVWSIGYIDPLFGAALTFILIMTSIVFVAGLLALVGESVSRALGWRPLEALFILPFPFMAILLIDVIALKL